MVKTGTAIDAMPLCVSAGDEILNVDGKFIALCMRGTTEDPLIAAYIVKAVNHHEALVALVRVMRGCLECTGVGSAAANDADDLLASLE